MSAQEIADMTNPTAADRDRVRQWLKSSLPSSVSLEEQGSTIKLTSVPVKSVETLFGCTLHRFTELPPPEPATQQTPSGGGDSSSGFHPRTIHRCVGEVTVPADVRDLLQGTIGLVDFPARWSHGPHPHPMPSGPNPRIGPIRGHAQPHGQGQSQAEQTSASASVPLTKMEGVNLPWKEFDTPVAHPHRTLRTAEQLNTAAKQFDPNLVAGAQHQQRATQ